MDSNVWLYEHTKRPSNLSATGTVSKWYVGKRGDRGYVQAVGSGAAGEAMASPLFVP